MADRARDARGRFTSGGGGESVGGIEATVSLDTQAFDPAIESILADLNRVEAGLAGVGKTSATATTSVVANMNNVGKSANAAGMNLMVFGQTLDDLQYVGEMGLRPILNNLMQISPVLGIAAIAVDQLVRRMDDFGKHPAAKTAAEEMKELQKQTKLTADEQERLNRLKQGEAGAAANAAGATEAEKKLLAGVGKAIDEADADKVKAAVQQYRKDRGLIQGMTEDDEAALKHAREKDARTRIAPDPLGIGTLFGAETFEQQKRAEIQKRIDAAENEAANAFLGTARAVTGPEGEGARKALREMARDRPELAKLGEGLDKAGRGAVKEPKFAVDHDAHVKAWRAAGAGRGDLEEAFAQGEAAAREEEGKRETLKKAGSDLAERGKRRDEVDDERRKKNTEALEGLRQGVGDRERLTERGSDLNYRLRQLVNPSRQGQSMGLDQYEASFKSQAGESPEAKRLHAIHEVLKDIKKNNERVKMIGVKRR